MESWLDEIVVSSQSYNHQRDPSWLFAILEVGGKGERKHLDTRCLRDHYCVPGIHICGSNFYTAHALTHILCKHPNMGHTAIYFTNPRDITGYQRQASTSLTNGLGTRQLDSVAAHNTASAVVTKKELEIFSVALPENSNVL